MQHIAEFFEQGGFFMYVNLICSTVTIAITGLIGAFAAVAKAAAADRSTILSAKIAEAMNNTWLGLAIAVTCMIGHVFLNAASKKQQHELEAFSMKLENLLVETQSHAQS